MQIDLPYNIRSIINSYPKPSLKELKDYIAQGHEWLLERHRRGATGFETVKGHTRLIDHLIERLFLNARKDARAKCPSASDRCSIVAIGGYGRGELNPYADIDILFLYPSSINNYLKALTEGILYPVGPGPDRWFQYQKHWGLRKDSQKRPYCQDSPYGYKADLRR